MKGNKILIIEDDADLRRALNVRLRASEYETAFASDAVMALSIAKKEAPDLILLDLGLPGDQRKTSVGLGRRSVFPKAG